jgi:hypothetical protein
MGAEDGEKDHHKGDKYDAPFAEGKKSQIELLVLADIHGTGLIVRFVLRAHFLPLAAGSGRTIANTTVPAIALLSFAKGRFSGKHSDTARMLACIFKLS